MPKSVLPKETSSYSKMVGNVYDLIYLYKDYKAEAEKLERVISKYCESGGTELLEAACGTGNYLVQLKPHFRVEGFDLSKEQVAAAKKKLPKARIVQADMINFNMNKEYDVILCLFSSIGYLQTTQRLNRAVANMARHVKPGGLVIIEPWIKADKFKEGNFYSDLADSDSPDLHVARLGIVTRNGILTTLNFHFMVSNSLRVEHFVERHKLAMYSDMDFQKAFKEAGLKLKIDRKGISGRGLYMGKKSLKKEYS